MAGKAKEMHNKIKDKLVFFGPGLLLAITAAGEAGIADAMEIGAHFGLSLVWVVIIALLFKYAFTTGIARYTLATGKTIFQAMTSIPGPKNWAAYFTIGAYIFEAIAVGAMAIYTATFVDYLIPGTYAPFLIALLVLLLALVVLRTHIYHHFEKIMAFVIVILSVILVQVLIATPSILVDVAAGVIPSIPHDSEKEILAIIGVVGSGLMLMLYSVWLKHKIDAQQHSGNGSSLQLSRETYKKYMTSVRLDIIIGFILVGLITIGFMAVGYLGFSVANLPHGSELSIDTLFSLMMNLFTDIPVLIYLFFIFFIIVFFGAITVGMDARASAITDVIKEIRQEAGKPVKNPSLVYNICIALFAVIAAIVAHLNEPLETMRFMALVCAILFGIFGFILIYLNTKLPAYARGSRLWMLLIGIGSVLSIYIALRLEGTIITSGLDMVRNLALILVVLFLFSRSKMFDRIVKGKGTLADKFWLVAILGVVCIGGLLNGVPVDNGAYYINFGDLGAIIAGIIGGPVIGGVVGLIGGLYRLSMGGGSAIPCSIAIMSGGIIAGCLMRSWNGKYTHLRAVIIVLAAEAFHLLFLFPTYHMVTATLSAPLILDAIRKTLLAISAVVAAGVICFGVFASKVDCFEACMQKFSIRRLKEQWFELIRKGDEEDRDDNIPDKPGEKS
ncbi:MAG TPA: Nramp family divalent metal transporter [Methanocorpusculum sp.]|nr:Nramp family divalent metal transporter [Methanocorpusculum sp.]